MVTNACFFWTDQRSCGAIMQMSTMLKKMYLSANNRGAVRFKVASIFQYVVIGCTGQLVKTESSTVGKKNNSWPKFRQCAGRLLVTFFWKQAFLGGCQWLLGLMRHESSLKHVTWINSWGGFKTGVPNNLRGFIKIFPAIYHQLGSFRILRYSTGISLSSPPIWRRWQQIKARATFLMIHQRCPIGESHF